MTLKPSRHFETADRRITSTALVVLAALIAVAAFVRLGAGGHWIGARDLTLDELWHVELSTGRGTLHYALPMDQLIDPPMLTSLRDAPPLPAIWTHMDGAVHPPLYVTLLRVWRMMFGDGKAAMRALSTIASIASLVLMFGVVRELQGTRAALWAAAIFAVAGAQVQAARDVRGYALLVTALLATTWAAARITRLGFSWSRIIALLLAALASLLTHYFSVFALAAIGISLVLLTNRRARIASICALLLAVAIFAVVWAPQISRQAAAMPAASEPWIYDQQREGHVARVAFDIATLPVRLLIATQNGVEALAWAVVGVCAYLLPLAFVKRRPELLFWYLWLLAMAGGLAAMDLVRGTRHLLYMRYIVAAGPALYALCTIGRHLTPALATLLCAVFVWQIPDESPRDYRSLARILDQRVSHDAVVVFFAPPPTRSSQALLLCLSSVSESYPWPLVMLSKPPDTALVARLRGASQVWLIVPGSMIPPEQVVGGDSRVQEKTEIPGVGSLSGLQFPRPN